MALTAEILKQQEPLRGLTDDQLTVIATLSATDEAKTVSEKMGTILGGIDTTLFEITGKTKPHGMKTSDFVKTELTTLKAAAATDELEALKAEKAALETQIAEGKGDEALKWQVAELQQQLADKETSITQLQTNLSKEKETYQNELKG